MSLQEQKDMYQEFIIESQKKLKQAHSEEEAQQIKAEIENANRAIEYISKKIAS